MKNLITYILVLFTITSCFKEENPIDPFDRGDAVTKTINTGNNGDYGDQIFYDLSGNREVKVIDRTSWDLAFETAAGSEIVRLNEASKMQASKTGITDFNAITNLTSLTLTFDWDKASGSEDSLALKDWITAGVPSNEVFIIDLGETPNLAVRGYKKLQILGVTATDFTIKYANINGSNEHTKTIPKQTAKNHTCFSFSGDGNVVDAEPDNDSWDLLFTQYLHTFYDSDPAVSYSVNGVLLNPKSVKAAKVFDKDFSAITISDVANYPLLSDWNTIGYDWKIFDFDTEIYQVDVTKNYIIKDRLGFYFKLRFVDFYNDSGIKGYPKFEFVRL